MKRFIYFAIILLMFIPTASVFAANNLIKNAGFEELTANNEPSGWEQKIWLPDEGFTLFAASSEEVHSDNYSAAIYNNEPNHARLIQNIDVKANTTYKFSGYVKASGLSTEAKGAHLYVDGIAVDYPHVTDTNNEWVYLEFYGKTGSKQKDIAFGVSVGGYGSLNKGHAFFDDVRMEKVSKTPNGVKAYSLQPNAGAGSNGEAAAIPMVSYFIVAILSTLFFLFIYQRVISRGGLRDANERNNKLLLAFVLLAAFIARVGIAITNTGYANDLALFDHWATHAAANGLAGVYGSDIFIDYPPGYVYVLYLIGLLKSMLGVAEGSGGWLLLLKLPAIAADIAAALLIYQISRKKLSFNVAIGLALLYAFNPATIVDSAAWGQVDSVFTLLLLLSFQSLANNRIRSASVWYAVAALVKPQAFIFMPVLLLYFVRGRKWKEIPVSALYGFGTFALLAMPFFVSNGGITALIELYNGTLSSYPYATLNAFNIYSLGNGNWKDIDKTEFLLSYRTWGNLFIVAAVAVAGWFSFMNTRRGKNKEYLNDRTFFIAMILITVVFLGVTKMHERYIFPIMLLSLFAFLQSLDRRLLYIYFGFSVTSYLNIAYVLDYSAISTYVPMNSILVLCALGNIALFIYMVYCGYDMYKRGNIKQIKMKSKEYDDEQAEQLITGLLMKAKPEEKQRQKLLQRKDWIWMGAITLIYAVVALVQLGSMKGPESVWQPASSNQSFYVDLGEVKQLEKINSFGGAGTGKFSYSFGVNEQEWSGAHAVDASHTSVFMWNSQTVDVAARYVKLSVNQTGFSIHELAFYEKGSEEPLSIHAIHSEAAENAKRGSVEQLFDEQQLAQYKATYMNGTYFDEIYHARTAYEHIEHLYAYESTHPPLGKILIAIGIKLFGLNPFGWRIIGTLVGIAMLPIIYVTARRLFGRTTYAATAAALFAAEFMHFTQTRIATIDVYGVFFIMLMFYFMSRYSSLSFYKVGLRATLLPLGLAGLFFGIGVASKWIVLYGGAGLAVMLALSLYDRYKEYRAAKTVLNGKTAKIDNDDKAMLSTIVQRFPKYTVLTLAFCLGFYIVIPLTIYALSYIPVLTAMQEGYTVKSFIDYQKNMFSYHSNLVSTHPFSSAWWEWPFMKRPVWYYSGSDSLTGQVSTIVAMGNPLIWWTGIVTMLITIGVSIKRKDKAIYMIWIAFLAQYVPWMLVTRLTYLYHYFAMVPFIILSIVYLFKVVEERRPSYRMLRYLFVTAAVLLFIMFYPALSGMWVSGSYVKDMLRWFPTWLF